MGACQEKGYKRDSLTVVSNISQQFLKLLNTKRGSTETIKNFEARFNAQVSKFKASADETKLPEAPVSFMLIANADIHNSQRVSVLAATGPTITTSSSSSNAECLHSVSYEKVASVLRQCDDGSNKEQKRTLAASYAHYNSNSGSKRNNRHQKQTLNPEQLQDLKSKSKCHLCNKFGHWKTDDSEDGSLKPNAKSTDTPEDASSNYKSNKKKKTLSFGMAKLRNNAGLDDVDITDLSCSFYGAYLAPGYRPVCTSRGILGFLGHYANVDWPPLERALTL